MTEARPPSSTLDLAPNTADLERRLIGAALTRTGGKRAAAARLLGISRKGLAMKIDRLGMAEAPLAG